jgi:hypothetical protein
VSANLRDAEGRLVAAPLRIVEAAGRRIGFTGVLGRQTIAGVQIDEPREALLRVLEEVRGRCDSLVVLAYLPEEELRSLAAALPEADAIVGGPTGQSIPPQQVGPALLAAATNKGKYLIELTAGPRGAVPAWSGRVAEMGKELTDDAGQQENLRRYLADLERRDLRAADTGLAVSLAQAEQRLAGTASCRSCHQADCSAWDKSGHAHAWDSLVKDGYQGDPYCQQCHTTGYGLPGGFDSMTRTPLARDVGCESCHGPAAAHARSPQTPTPLRARSQCQRCHDVENSPQFDYAGYWPRIRHGQPSREAPSP